MTTLFYIKFHGHNELVSSREAMIAATLKDKGEKEIQEWVSDDMPLFPDQTRWTLAKKWKILGGA